MSGFSHARIEPLNPPIVLDKLQIRPTTLKDNDGSSSLPMDTQGIHQLVKKARRHEESRHHMTSDLIKLVEKLSFKNDILEHENKGLRHTLIQKRQKKKNLTSLNLVASGDPKYGQFFSPEKVQQARDEIQTNKDTAEHEKAIKMEKKLQNKLAKEAKKQDYRQQVEKRKEDRRIKKAQKDNQVLAHRQLRMTKQLQRLEDRQKAQMSKTQKTQKEPDLELIDIGEAFRVMEQSLEQISRSGRRVKKPSRF
jgi:hypothetical protein